MSWESSGSATVPVAEAIIRSKFKFEPFPDTPNTLEKRLKLYKEYLNMDKNLIHIDGTRDINKIKKEIHFKVGLV